jgi:hypothetical protein
MTDNNTKREFLKFHDERGVPDLQKLIVIFGSDSQIPAWAWVQWDEANAAYQQRLRQRL